MAKLVASNCPNCGASLEIDKDAAQVECRYCHTVLQIQQTRKVPPPAMPPPVPYGFGSPPPPAKGPMVVYVKKSNAALVWIIVLTTVLPIVAVPIIIIIAIAADPNTRQAVDAIESVSEVMAVKEEDPTPEELTDEDIENWDGEDTLECVGERTVEISDVESDNGLSTTIRIKDSCHLILSDVKLIGSTGVTIADEGKLTLKSGSIKGERTGIYLSEEGSAILNAGTEVSGGKLAIHASDESKVTAKGKLVGEIKQQHEATVSR